LKVFEEILRDLKTFKESIEFATEFASKNYIHAEELALKLIEKLDEVLKTPSNNVGSI
jgi:hypothetical protein